MSLPESRKRKLADLMLLSLEKSADGYLRIQDFTYHHYRYKYGIPNLKRSAFSMALKRLRENGLVEFVDDQELLIRLTAKGKDRAVVLNLLWEGNLKWDGKWRIVIFDVPEKRRAARDLLRIKLKEWGFIKWQQSVWVTKKNCTEVLRNYIRQVGIEDWILVIESDNIGR